MSTISISYVCSGLRSTSIRNAVAKLAKEVKASCFPIRISKQNSLSHRIFRSPAMSCYCVESMLPYHNATASALLISMLSVFGRGHGWLSEDG